MNRLYDFINRFLFSYIVVCTLLFSSTVQAAYNIDAYVLATGKTALMEAVSGVSCNAHVIHALIKLGADIEKIDDQGGGMTALMISAESGCTVGTELLMAERAKWRVENTMGFDAFQLALNNQRYESASVILTELAGEPVTVVGNGRIDFIQKSVYLVAKRREAKERQIKQLEAAEPKVLSVKLTMGFSLRNTNDSALSTLNSRLEGKYRLSESVEGEGKVEIFFSKEDGAEAQERYLIQNRLIRKSLFSGNWDGTVDIQLETTNSESEAKAVALIERNWVLNEHLRVRLGVGPGIRVIGYDDALVDGGSDFIASIREEIVWSPNDIFGWKTEAILTQGYDGDYGQEGKSHRISFGIDYPLEKGLSIGISAIYWNRIDVDGTVGEDQLITGQIKKTWK